MWTRPDDGSTAWSNSVTFGDAGLAPGALQEPWGVAVTADQLTLLVADMTANRISVWTRPDVNSTVWTNTTNFGTKGAGVGNLTRPFGVFVSADGLTAWVADSGNYRITVWTRPDAASTAWGQVAQFGTRGKGDDNFDFPLRVTASKDALTAWIVDVYNNRIAIWTRPDATSTTWSYSAQFGAYGYGDSDFDYPSGVSVSPDTLTAWVSDRNNARVALWTRPNAASKKWSYQKQFGSPGTGVAEFKSPIDVVAAPDSLTVWVVDMNNDRISVWTQG